MARTINDRNSCMRTVGDVEQVRSHAAALVDREEFRLRSRMLGYETVGAMVGISGSWLRRFVNRYDEYQPSETVMANIKAMYLRLCSRVEDHSDTLSQEIAVLTESLDAARARADTQLEAPAEGEAIARRVRTRVPKSSGREGPQNGPGT